MSDNIKVEGYEVRKDGKLVSIIDLKGWPGYMDTDSDGTCSKDPAIHALKLIFNKKEIGSYNVYDVAAELTRFLETQKKELKEREALEAKKAAEAAEAAEKKRLSEVVEFGDYRIEYREGGAYVRKVVSPTCGFWVYERMWTVEQEKDPFAKHIKLFFRGKTPTLQEVANEIKKFNDPDELAINGWTIRKIQNSLGKDVELKKGSNHWYLSLPEKPGMVSHWVGSDDAAMKLYKVIKESGAKTVKEVAKVVENFKPYVVDPNELKKLRFTNSSGTFYISPRANISIDVETGRVVTSSLKVNNIDEVETLLQFDR